MECHRRRGRCRYHSQGPRRGKGTNIEFVPLDGASKSAPRLVSGVAEFDRVTGGGLVPGSAILVGGDPGIGKSTILLQVAGAISKKSACAYISGEEAVDQVRMRADRLGLAEASVQLAAATNVRDIVATLDIADPPRLVIIDSIQTMYLDNLESAPGSVSQVRSTADTLIRLAKRRGFTLILVGHVTKEGTIAGPEFSNTWSIPFFTSRANAVTSSACYGRSRTVSDRQTRSASSR